MPKNTMQKIEALVFDLDGTLLDSLHDLADSMNHVLRERGHPTHPTAAYRIFVGDGVEELVRRVLPDTHRGDGAYCRELAASMRARYAEHWADASRPYPGVEDMLARLDLPLCVLSNKPDAFTLLCVRHFFPDVPWRVVRGACDGTPLKPDPQAARAIAAALGCPVRHLAMVGDTSTDMRTAMNAGMTAWGVTWGFRDRAELLNAGAHRLFDHPLELPPACRPSASTD